MDSAKAERDPRAYTAVSEFGTDKTVSTRIWFWLSNEIAQTLDLIPASIPDEYDFGVS